MIEAVAERLEGAPRQLRRRWSDAFKAQLIAEALEPGASVSAIAHRVGIHPSQLFAWRRAARDGRYSRLQVAARQRFKILPLVADLEQWLRSERAGMSMHDRHA